MKQTIDTKTDLFDVYFDFFKTREDVFATQAEQGHYRPVIKPLTRLYIKYHLHNFDTYGVYLLNQESNCNFICLDIDIPKDSLSEVNFQNDLAKFNFLKDKLYKLIDLINKEFNITDDMILLEDTGGRGYHIWLFFENPIYGEDIIKLKPIIDHYIDFGIEFFPKQGSLNKNRKYGNLIKLPLGFHQKYKKSSRFFYLNNGNLELIEKLENNLEHLAKIQKIPNELIYQIIEKHNTIPDIKMGFIIDFDDEAEVVNPSRPLYKGDIANLTENCSVLSNLIKKSENGNIFTHKEAFTFTNLMLSAENSENMLTNTLKKAFGSDFNYQKTQNEIDQIKPLHPTSCNKLIADKLCTGDCLKRQENENNPNPLSLFLKPIMRTFTENQILEAVSDRNNLLNSFYKLKKHHKEDSVFFDPFDFEEFEKNININIDYISQQIKDNYDIPFFGYKYVKLPKSTDENGNLQYRKLAYSTIYDQIVIQSFFNIVSQYFEEDFYTGSMGARVDTKNFYSDEIFEDWKKKFPEFRDKALHVLRKPNIQYYLCCDIKGFYDNINHDILIHQLKTYPIKNDYIIKTLEKIIKLYEFEEDSGTGVPQGPAYARILANLYLDGFDHQIKDHCDGYFRYVDDCFFFFETEEKAKTCLAKINEFLENLSLTLSQSPAKAPEIITSNNEDKILSRIDELRYGIFEESKFIDNLDKNKVKGFYTKIKDKKLTFKNVDELIEINTYIPTLVFLISNKSKQDLSFQKNVTGIIEYLIQNQTFYPKRLKGTFKSLIPFINDKYFENCTIYDFYKRLDPCHKIYYLLSLYEISKKEEKYQDDLIKITNNEINSQDIFIRGFSIAIKRKLIKDDISYITEEFINTIFSNNDYFLVLKFLTNIDLNILSSSIKNDLLTKLIPLNSNNYLINNYLINENFKNSLFTYNHKLQLKSLIDSDPYYLLVYCCKLFSLLQDSDELLLKLIEYFSAKHSFKQFIIKYLRSLIFERHKHSDKFVLESLEKLYESKIQDTELKRNLINIIRDIQEANTYKETEFNKSHIYINSFGECYFYRTIEDNLNYNFMEIIPKNKLDSNNYDYQSSEFENKILKKLSEMNVLPILTYEIDTEVEKAKIKYLVNTGEFETFRDFDLSKSNNKDILSLLAIIKDVYYKSEIFFAKTGKIPYISEDNIWVNYNNNTIMFKTISRSFELGDIFSVDVIKFDNKHNIPSLLSYLLYNLLFKSEEEYKSFNAKKQKGTEFVISFLLNALQRKQEQLRLSFNRYDFLIKQLTELDNNQDILSFYLTERFKSNLYKENFDSIHWNTICKALLNFYGEAYKVYNVNNRKINIKSPFILGYESKLHYLSKQILEVIYNSRIILSFNNENLDENFPEFFTIINNYAVFCIESISFFKTINLLSNKQVEELSEINQSIMITYENYQLQLNPTDIRNINTLLSKFNQDKNPFTLYVGFNLKQIAITYILCNSEFTVNDKGLTIAKFINLNHASTEKLMLNFLIRLPFIEDNVNKKVHTIISMLSQKFTVDDEYKELNCKIKYYLKDLTEIRKKLKLKRNQGNISNKEGQTNLLYCNSSFKKEYKAELSMISKIPLGNLFPSSKYKGSWDLYNNNIFNIVIPNERITEFIGLFKKSIKQRLFYFYSNKTMLFVDLILSILLVVVFFYIEYFKNTEIKELKAFLEIPKEVVKCMGYFFLGKTILFDTKYWFPQINIIWNFLRDWKK